MQAPDSNRVGGVVRAAADPMGRPSEQPIGGANININQRPQESEQISPDTKSTPLTTRTTDDVQRQQQPASSSTEQQDADSSQTVKQFSDKTLEELADYYLGVGPADIPDTGFVVSGIAGRFPNADNLNELWENLKLGRDMVLGPDDKRWPLGKFLCSCSLQGCKNFFEILTVCHLEGIV